MPINRETMLTMDEMRRAGDLAAERFHAMLCEANYLGETPDPKSDLAQMERNLACVAWRQAMTFVLVGRDLAESGVSG